MLALGGILQQHASTSLSYITIAMMALRRLCDIIYASYPPRPRCIVSSQRVTIVSSHPLLAAATAQVRQFKGIALAGSAPSIHSVAPLIREHRYGVHHWPRQGAAPPADLISAFRTPALPLPVQGVSV
jgi:hypothetical protein